MIADRNKYLTDQQISDLMGRREYWGDKTPGCVLVTPDTFVLLCNLAIEAHIENQKQHSPLTTVQ